MYNERYIDGYLERKPGGSYEGVLSIEGVDISPIEGMYFEENNEQYLWLRRKRKLEYDNARGKFIPMETKPKWESYLKKQKSESIAYKGNFFFLHFAYIITGIWDGVYGKDERRHRLNFIVERKPMDEQNIINSINKQKQAK